MLAGRMMISIQVSSRSPRQKDLNGGMWSGTMEAD